MNKSLYLLNLFIVFFVFALSHDEDPYYVLNVRRTASSSEIKRAYKELAKRWHPDKNQSPEAERKFVQINRAYEILSDPKRKERYDRYGATEENEGGGGRNDFHFDPFGDFFGQFNSRPHFFNKHRIGLRIYETLLEKSYSTPYLIFVYSDFCMLCMRAESIWENVVNELEPLGYGIATVNSMREGSLVDKLRVNYEPSIVALIEGRPVSYRGRVIEARALKDFARQAIPAHYVDFLNDGNFRQWMDDNWRQRNKISVVMCGPQDRPRLRFLLAAMRFRAYASFGYVPLKNSATTSEFRTAYGVTTSTKNAGGLETFMVFNERTDSPAVVIQAKEIPTDSLISALEANKFLILPRLSSQKHFDDLCPPSTSSSTLKQLCVILLARAKADEMDHTFLSGYREFVENSSLRLSSGLVRYVYLYEDRQRDFVNGLTAVSKTSGAQFSNDPNRRDVVVLWRTDKEQARLEWLRGIWASDPELVNKSAESLLLKIETILQQSDVSLLGRVSLNQLVDENSPIWYKYWFATTLATWDTLVHYISKEELFPIISVVGTLVLMLTISCCLGYITDNKKMPNARRRSRDWRQSSNRWEKSTTNAKADEIYHSGIQIEQLDHSSYMEMVTSSPPGVRTIVILVSREAKDSLLRRFARCLAPWKDHHALKYGYIILDDHFDWFYQLCGAANLDVVRRSDLRHLVGTVLSLNGHRRYFNIFYPNERSVSRRFQNKRTDQDNQFLAFDSSSSSEEDDSAKRRLEFVQLLDTLPNWLERLFEGCCQKYSVSDWPLMS